MLNIGKMILSLNIERFFDDNWTTMRRILFILSCFPILCLAQNYDEVLKKAYKARNEFKYIEALALFQALLKTDSSNTEYLCNTSVLFSKAGNMQPDQKKKFEYFAKGEYLAKKAIATDKNFAEAHYAYALALGRKNENASSKEKIANAKAIRSAAETAVRLNPAHAGAWHILGRWHETVAGFSLLEKMAINTLYGGVPEGGSYDAAIDCFKHAIRIEPHMILHYYELGLSYKERGKPGDEKLARENFEKALSLPEVTPEDAGTKTKCREALK